MLVEGNKELAAARPVTADSPNTTGAEIITSKIYQLLATTRFISIESQPNFFKVVLFVGWWMVGGVQSYFHVKSNFELGWNFDGIQPLMETTFDGRQPLMENNL